LRINAETGRKAPPLSFSSKMLSMSLGYEKVEEVGEEDSSKDIILKNGLHFLYAKLLISSSSTSSSSS
jgi:hypothetical protein